MNGRHTESPQAASLRERAEKVFREMFDSTLENLAALSPETLRASLHELRVHQIELEMQNEEMLRSQEKLAASRARYFDLYDLAPVGYITVSEQGLILEANLTAATLLGRERAALVGQRLSAFISKEGQDLYYRCRKNLSDPREPLDCDLRMVRHDGASFSAHLKVAAARDENGAAVCRLVLIDVSAHRRAEEDLRKLRMAVEQSANTIIITDPLGNIEYVNPAFEKSTGYTAAEAMGRNPRVLKSGRHDEVFYKNLWATVTSGKIWRGEFQNKRKDGTLYWESATISPVLDDQGKIAADKGLKLLCAVDPGLPEQITGDARRIRQILINLIGNAVKFTASGSVVVRATPSSSAGRPAVDFSIVDTGPGMRSVTVNRLFNPFMQADMTLRRPFEGTGLGLAISQRLAEAMGGTISVVSAPGQGSTFTLRIPEAVAEVVPLALENPLPVEAPSTQAGGAPGPRETHPLVLVVEDDASNSSLAGKMLEALGCQAEFAFDGQEAVRAYAPGKFSAILMDMQMPVLDGLTATEKIRALEGASGVRVPIIALTANVMSGDRERCLAAGMDDFLSKPFTKSGLASKLPGVAAG